MDGQQIFPDLRHTGRGENKGCKMTEEVEHERCGKCIGVPRPTSHISHIFRVSLRQENNILSCVLESET